MTDDRITTFLNWLSGSSIQVTATAACLATYFVLLLHRAFRRGNFVRVIDVDNYIEGYISEVNVFNTKLITADREVVIYPNNLLISRPTLINPRRKLNSVGKITDVPAAAAVATAE